MKKPTNLLSKDIEWKPVADREMSLATMIDYLYEDKLIKNFSYRLLPYKPKLTIVYRKHSELLKELVKIICGGLTFTPSKINEIDSNESHLYFLLIAIRDIEWFQTIEAHKKEGWSENLKEYNKAHTLIQRYSIEKVPFDFPLHQNEIIKNIEQALNESRRKNQSHEIITPIKKHFNIIRATATDRQKLNKRLDEMIKLHNFHNSKRTK